MHKNKKLSKFAVFKVHNNVVACSSLLLTVYTHYKAYVVIVHNKRRVKIVVIVTKLLKDIDFHLSNGY